jgi:hypothetical protein
MGQFSGSKPSGLSPQRDHFKFREALDKSLTGFEEARPLRVFKEARPDFGPFATECGAHKRTDFKGYGGNFVELLKSTQVSHVYVRRP